MSTSGHFLNYDQGIESEISFINAIKTPNNIVIMGSSELASEDINYTKPFNFIPKYTNYDVLGIGHAGNQSFSIFSQLLSVSNYLKNSKIVVIISPSWFTNKYGDGTSVSSFLEFNKARFLINIASEPNENFEYKNYISEYIYNNYSLIESPDFGINSLYYYNLSNRNIINKIVYYPIYGFLNILNNYSRLNTNKFYNYAININHQLKKNNITNINNQNFQYSINWDSLFNISINYQKSISTNNSWGINNDYYSNITKKRDNKRRIQVKDKWENQELNDMMMLIDLLMHYESNPVFIIQALNPYAYDELCQMQPIIDKIIIKLNNDNIPVLNQFTCYKDKYEIGVLTDAMHMGDLGWYKVNKFIIENYNNE